MKTPERLQDFIYYLTKDAARDSFEDWLEETDINDDEYDEIKEWFKQFDIKPYV
ncbi:hypothetical protein M0L63_RS04410 [Providencia rettgeri]|uniref:hypothetical protein n=1 Tax=Providencia sp. PROV260 TaxID=2949948 RepID=UPI00234AE39A|nr:hypothetical protein [Providencia sp. PROV260]EJD6581937.1 hypothetical protein [Providencia rettgeri]